MGGARAAWIGLLLACSALGPSWALDAETQRRLEAARDAAARRPDAGLAALEALRAVPQPGAGPPLALRLAIDELECRLLTDLDVSRALAVADAGLSAAGPQADGNARDAWLRLRACRAGMLAEAGEVAEARRELQALHAATADAPQSAAAALVHLERGVMRSRGGDYEAAQSDLQRACQVLDRTGPRRDHLLCLSQLAGHYRRVGDHEEALRLLQPLRAAAGQAGETYDESIYLYGIARTLQDLARWDEALRAFEQARAANVALGDRLGIGYAETALAAIMLSMQRPGDALPHVQRALAHVDRSTDPRLVDELVITQAQALTATGQAAQAYPLLSAMADSVRARGSLPMQLLWLRARADAGSALGQWRQAYQDLAAAQQIESTLQVQRRSEQAARLRAQFNRARDGEELAMLRQLHAQGQELRRLQAVALGLVAALLLAALTLTLRKVLQARRLQSLASTDELTGIANRRAVMARLDSALAAHKGRGAPLSLAMIDVDHFKRINDTLGHAVGDEVLRHLARVLAGALRDGDRLGRIGGEEFVAVLQGAAQADALQVAERMRAAVARTPLARAQGEVALTISVGVATAGAGSEAGRLLAAADAALYQAKARGRNRVETSEDAPAPESGDGRGT